MSEHDTEAVEFDAHWIIDTQLTGDGSNDWVEEFALLLDQHGPRLAQLLLSMSEDGQRVPIAIEPSDHRVLDGHHRLLCALLLGRKVKAAFGYAAVSDE